MALGGCAAPAPAPDPGTSPATTGACPEAFLDFTTEQSETSGLENVVVREIPAAEFEPASIAEALDGGCLFVIEYVSGNNEGRQYQGYVPGGEDILSAIDTALVAEGYEDEVENFYRDGDGNYVAAYPAGDPVSAADLAEQGLTGFGDDIVIVNAYQG